MQIDNEVKELTQRFIDTTLDPFDRNDAARALAKFGPKAAAAIPVLIAALRNSSDPYFYINAIMALGEIGPEAKAAVPALAGKLFHASGSIRELAAWSIGQIGRNAGAATDALIEMLSDSEWRLHLPAIQALARIGPDAAAAVPALIAAMKERYLNVDYNAARALGSIGPAAHTAVPALLDAARDPNNGLELRLEAVSALGGIQAVSALIELFRPQVHFHARDTAAAALFRLGALAREALPALDELLEDRSRHTANTKELVLRAIREIRGE